MPAHSPETSTDGSGTSTRSSAGSTSGTNSPRWRRVGAAVLGGALLVSGLRRRSARGAVMALVGGWLSYRAVSDPSRRSHPLESTARDGREETEEGFSVTQSVTIGKPADELSAFVRDPENLKRILEPVADVDSEGEEYYWTVQGPLERRLSWETRVAEDRPGERLRWESIDGPLEGEWSMDFRPAPGDRGTEVTLEVRFFPPGGRFGRAAMERLEIVSETLLATVLDRLKSLSETGEIATLEDNPSARGAGDLL